MSPELANGVIYLKSLVVVRTDLRKWQKDAFALYLERLSAGERALLYEATPGAGKTTAALQIVRHQLVNKLAKRALIVVPTSHLRGQWASSALREKIQLESSRANGLAADYHGAVITYQQLGRGSRWIRELASQSVVVLDEVHHAGEGLSWGEALQTTMKESPFVLCLSGTAFRSDGNQIPFLHYDETGASQPDYTYTYTQAVQDGVCRPTAFFTYGGEVSWTENQTISTANFSDPLDAVNSARRLRAALAPEAQWIQPLLKDAHHMLTVTREEDRDAAGLIVCADQDHAREVAHALFTITGERPVVVLSDDATASKKIKRFSEGNAPWLVACNMVSEGVDIPRLRIGVYATTIRTKMYFRQFLGRVVRRRHDITTKQIAYVYLPSDPTLRTFAEEIEDETRHLLHSAVARDDEDRLERVYEKTEPSWMPMGATNSGVDAIIVHGNQLSFLDTNVPSMREAVHLEVESRQASAMTRSEVKNQLTSDIKTLVGLVNRRSRKPHSVIHTILNKTQSVRSQAMCTEEQLQNRKQLLEEMLRASSHPLAPPAPSVLKRSMP